MFRLLKEYFARPDEPLPIRGRGRRLAQVFAFEFVVVLLGVLAAQLLQDWFAERGDARRARAAVAAFDEETKRFATTAEYRLRAHECETGRLARLAEIIRAGGTATEVERATPIMPMPVITGWSEDTRQVVARHVGPAAISRFDAIEGLARMMWDRQRQLEDQWADFRLLAAQGGSGRNRAQLELAAARSEGLLSAIDMNAGLVGQYAKGVRPDRTILEWLGAMDHPCASVALKPVAPDSARPQ